MTVKLKCNRCSKDMGELRDARTRNGYRIYCAECDVVIQRALRIAGSSTGAVAGEFGTFVDDLFKGLKKNSR